jgi:hypothetical protein
MIEYAAQLNDNIVQQVIVGNYEWATDNVGGIWVDCTCGDNPCASISYIYDPVTETFTAPPAPIEQ